MRHSFRNPRATILLLLSAGEFFHGDVTTSEVCDSKVVTVLVIARPDRSIHCLISNVSKRGAQLRLIVLSGLTRKRSTSPRTRGRRTTGYRRLRDRDLRLPGSLSPKS